MQKVATLTCTHETVITKSDAKQLKADPAAKVWCDVCDEYKPPRSVRVLRD